jgi:hypothetical protein
MEAKWVGLRWNRGIEIHSYSSAGREGDRYLGPIAPGRVPKPLSDIAECLLQRRGW